MRHAGISVTVTSITDVMAFGLGAFTIMPGLQVLYFIQWIISTIINLQTFTIMPGLQAFCVSAAICIALIFLLQVDIT